MRILPYHDIINKFLVNLLLSAYGINFEEVKADWWEMK